MSLRGWVVVVVVITSVNETRGKHVQITGAQGPNMLHTFGLCRQNESNYLFSLWLPTACHPSAAKHRITTLFSCFDGLATWYAIFNVCSGIIHTINLTYCVYCSKHVSKPVNQVKYVAVPSTLPQQCLKFITTVSHELRPCKNRQGINISLHSF